MDWFLYPKSFHFIEIRTPCKRPEACRLQRQTCRHQLWRGRSMCMVTKRKNRSQSGFPKESMMRSFLLTILLVLVVSPAWALTSYYVDPDYTGGTRDGNAATPWHSFA